MYNGVQANIGLNARWTSVNSFSPPTMVTGRFGGQALSLQSQFAFGNSTAVALMFPGNPTSISFGFAFKPVQTSNLSQVVNILNSSLSALCGIGFNASGQLVAYQGAGGTTLGTSVAAGLAPASTWIYVELEIVLSGSAGTLNAYVNGQQVLALTGVNTGSGAAVAMQLVLLAPTATTYTCVWDDIYTTNAATKLGEQRIETLRPASNSSVQWTPSSGSNYADVNGTTVSGTTYVSTATVGNLDLYGIAALSETPSTISAVNVVSFAEKTDAGLRAINNAIKSGSVEQDGSAIYLAGSFGRFDNIQLTDPATSAAWTASGVNGLLIGPKLAA